MGDGNDRRTNSRHIVTLVIREFGIYRLILEVLVF